jgi:GNAT superfamily N-acetyltransferase
LHPHARGNPWHRLRVPGSPALLPTDLAPGDRRHAQFDWTGLHLRRLAGPDDPWFQRAYDRLWHEFGHRNEMEARPVVAARLLNPDPLRYELLVIHADDGELIAVRDHTAIAGHDAVVVHLSHVVVEPAHRGTGLAAWLRAFPLQTARACADAAGLRDPDITLVAEMEHPDGLTPDVARRLRSYARAGFRMVDPAAAPYHQPDFRPPAEIDATSLQPVPLALIVRRVGREHARALPGAELRALVGALYTIYAAGMRPEHMAPLWSQLAAYPDDHVPVALLPPLP